MLRNIRRNILKGRILFVVLFIVFIVCAFVFASRAGSRLVMAHDTESADLIMVLMGPVPDRALQTADLYHRGVSSSIVFCNDFQPGARQLLEHNIILDNIADIARNTLIKLGVLPEDIIVLDHFTASTQDEALRLRDYLLENTDIRSVILVTSSYHSRRTYKIFNKVLNRSGLDIQLSVSENPYTDFNGEKWWRDRSSATMVVFEYLKLANFYLIEQHRIKRLR